jgi:hypothetical protein
VNTNIIAFTIGAITFLAGVALLSYGARMMALAIGHD